MAFNSTIPVSTNVITEDVAAINGNWEYILQGDGTAGRVLRFGKLKIRDGTNANTVKCELDSMWNGDDDGPTDNCAKGATTRNYTLPAGGTTITVEAAGITGNAVAGGVLGYNNNSNTDYNVTITVASNDLVFTLYDLSGSSPDWTAVVDAAGGDVQDIYFFYITSA